MPSKQLFKVTGDETIIKAFRQLGDKVSKGVVKPAAQRAAKKFQDVAKANAPVLTGKMRRSAKVITARGPRDFKGRKVIAFAMIIGKGKASKREKESGTKIPYYTFMQERGFHTGVRHRVGQKVAGYTPATGNLGSKGVTFHAGKFFVKKALKANEGPIQAAMLSEIYHGIEALASKG